MHGWKNEQVRVKLWSGWDGKVKRKESEVGLYKEIKGVSREKRKDENKSCLAFMMSN